MSLPEHLGGHANYTNNDEGVLKFLIKEFKPSSFFDIGCGPGGMVKLAAEKGLTAKGLDGDFTLDFGGLDVTLHDFTLGPAPDLGKFDLGWCVEVLEHVEEKFLDNIAPAFQACSHLWVTHAVPGQNGHHHVNCRDQKYWIKVFRSWGFWFDSQNSTRARARSTMKGKFSKRTGMLIHKS